MTKKHFKGLAEIVKSYGDTLRVELKDDRKAYDLQGQLANEIASFCRAQNPRFNWNQFLAACGCEKE